MIFLATGTNAGATDLLLDFSGRLSGALTFSYAKVANTANDASPRTSDLKIQYSLDNGLTFTDVTGYTIPRISNNSTAESGSLNVTLPPDLNGRSQVVLRFFFWNNGQTGGTGNRPKWSIDSVAVTSSASANAPTIAGFSPEAGSAGTVVTVTGTNFVVGGTTVRFGAVEATAVTVAGSTSLTATVPAGATTARISVTTADGTATSTNSFIVIDGSGTATVLNGTAGSSFLDKNLFNRATPAQTLRVVYSPPGAGTIEGLRVELPAGFTGLSQGNVIVSGGGGSPVVAVSGQTLTVSGLAATTGNPVTISVAGLTTPDTSTPITNSGNYTVSVSSRGSSGTLAPIASPPVARVLIPIANAQNRDAANGYLPTLAGQTVAVEGVCNVGKLAARATSTALQDATHGIALDSTIVQGPQTLGNRYVAVGLLSNFSGLAQISLAANDDLIDLGPAAAPAAITATVPQFTTAPGAFNYQSRVVRVENLSKVSGTWGANQNVVLQDTNANQITVRIVANSTATTEPTYPVTVTGVAGQFDNATPFDSGFQLQPRDPADLQPPGGASLSFDPTTIESLSSTAGVAGSAVDFQVRGEELTTGTITISAPAPFEVSTTSAVAGDFGPSATLIVSVAGAFTGNAWVRIGAGATAGPVSGNLSASGAGAAAKTLPVSGNVAALPPTVQLNTTGPLALGTVVQGAASASQIFTVQGSNLTGTLLITPPTGVEVSNNGGTTWNPSTLIITPSSGSVPLTNISVRIADSATPGSINANVVVGTAGIANQNVAVTGTVTAVPTIIPSPTTLAPITKVFDDVSPTRNFTVTGNTLSGPVTVTAPVPFEVSLQQNSGYVTSLSLAPTTVGNIPVTTIYVRIADATPVGPISARDISLAGGGATAKTVSVSGQVTALAAVINVNPNILDGFFAVSGNASAVQSFTVTASGLTEAVDLAAPTKYELSTDDGVTFGSSSSLSPVDGAITGRTVLVRVSAGAAAGTADGAVLLASGTGIKKVEVRGIVTVATPLTLRVPPQILAPAETPARVSITTPSLVDVVVSLFSDQEPVVSVPRSVVIPRGETTAFFTIRTLSVGAPITARVDAIAENYQATFATTEVSSNVTRAASLTELGYMQDFATFVSDRTLPFGWRATRADGPFSFDYSVFSAWGTTNAGLKFSVPGTNVFGFQHEPGSVFAPSFVATQILTLRNDWTSNITRLRIRYDGRTTTARTPADRDPAYTVRIVSVSGTGTNAVTNVNTVSLLNYGTGEGDDKTKTASVLMTNTAFPTGVPPWSTFIVTWTSDSGSGFDASKQIGISDLQVDLVRPVVTLTNLEGVTDFSTTVGTPSSARPFRVTGQDLSGNIVITAPTGYALSTNTNTISGRYSNSITLTQVSGAVTNATIFARLTGATPPGVGVVEGILKADSPNADTPSASASRAIGGTVFAASGAQVYASTKVVKGLVAYRPQPSEPKTFHVSGRGLPAGIVLTAPLGFELRVGSIGAFGTSVVVPRDSAGSVSPQPIEVRLIRTQLGAYSGDISITSGGVVYDPVRVEGDVVLPPSVIALTGQFTPFSTTRGTPSAPQSSTVEASGLTAALVVAASEGYQVSLGGAYSESVSLNPTNGVVAATTISVRLADYAPATASLPGAVTASSTGALTRSLPLTGSVSTNANAWISARPSPLRGFVALPAKASEPQTFVVQGANLVTGIALTAPNGYEISLDGSAWLGSLTLQAREPLSAGSRDLKQGPTIIQDAIGDIAPAINSAGGTLDIVSMEVSDTATDLVFSLTVNGNISTSDWGNFAIGIANGKTAGSTTGNGWGRPINLEAGGGNGMTHWIASWVNNGGGSQLWTYSLGGGGGTGANWSGPSNLSGYTFTPGAQSVITYTVSQSALGVGAGDTIVFDAYSTGEAGNPSAVDALSNPNVSIADWPGPYTSSATTGISSYTISGGGGGGSGDVAPTTVLVRLKSGLPVGPVSGNLQASSSPATPRVVVLEGRVADFPELSADPSSLRQLLTTAGTVSTVQSFVLSGTELEGPVSVSLPTNSGFEISLSASSGFSTNLAPLLPINGTLPGTTIYVRIPASTPAGRLASQVNVSGFGQLFAPVSLAVPISGTVFAAGGAAQISFPEPDQLTGFSTTAGSASPSQSFVVSGINLTAPITATVGAPYEVSAGGPDGPYGPSASTVAPNPAPGPVSSAVFHVRLAASATVGSALGEVTLSSAGAANRTVTLSGSVAPTPTLAVAPSSLQFSNAVAGNASDPQTFVLQGANLVGDVTVRVTAPYEISLTQNSGYGAQLIAPRGAGSITQNIYVRVSAAATAGRPGGVVTFESQGVIDLPLVTLSAVVLPRPEITVVPTALSGFAAVEGYLSTNQLFTVSGADLLNSITVQAPSSYEVSLTGTNGWADTIVLDPQFPAGPDPGAPPVTVASDNAGNYVGVWGNGSNGGTGFLPWVFTVNDNSSGNPPPPYFAGGFIGDPGSAGITGFGTEAFGLYANPANTAASVAVDRPMITPLEVGGSFSVQWAVNWDAGDGNKGFSLFAGATEVVRVNQENFPGNVTVNGALAIDGETGYGTEPMTWSFAMSSSNNLLVTSTGRTGGAAIVYSNNIPLTAPIDLFRAYTTAMTEGDERQSYFNSLRQTAPGGGTGGFVTPTQIFVRLKSNVPPGAVNQTINVTSAPYAIPRIVTLSGNVLPQTLTVNPAALSGFTTTRGVASAAQQFTVSGTNLVTNVTVTAPANYEVSSTSDTAGFAQSVVIPVVPAGPLGGSISIKSLWVRISEQALDTSASGVVSLVSDRAAASVQLNGVITDPRPPALNANFADFLYDRLLYRAANSSEIAAMVANPLGGNPAGIAAPGAKAQAIMSLMAYNSSTGLFNFTAEYGRTSAIALAPYARLDLIPQKSSADPTIRSLVNSGIRADTQLLPLTGTYSGISGAPYGATYGMARAMQDIFESGQFFLNFGDINSPNFNSGAWQPQYNLYNWLRDPMFKGRYDGASGSTALPALMTNSGVVAKGVGPGAGAAFWSVYVSKVLELGFDPAGSALEKVFQSTLGYAGLNLQIWGGWNFTGSYTLEAVTGLLRLPAITSGALPNFVPGVAYDYTIDATNGAQCPPSFGLPRGLYFSVSGDVPAGLRVNPATGKLFFLSGSAPTAGSYTMTLHAQNFVGTASKSVSLTVEGSQIGPASQWRKDQGLGVGSFSEIMNVDHDGDGFTALHEYAFGLNPILPETSAWTQSHNGSEIVLTWKGLESGATYRVLRSGNLTLWEEVSGVVQKSALEGGYQSFQMRFQPEGDREFYRLQSIFEPGALE